VLDDVIKFLSDLAQDAEFARQSDALAEWSQRALSAATATPAGATELTDVFSKTLSASMPQCQVHSQKILGRRAQIAFESHGQMTISELGDIVFISLATAQCVTYGFSTL